jgi:hypothetical protein
MDKEKTHPKTMWIIKENLKLKMPHHRGRAVDGKACSIKRKLRFKKP